MRVCVCVCHAAVCGNASLGPPVSRTLVYLISVKLIMLTETENIDHELALTIFTQKALKFENLTLFYEFGGVF